MATRNAINKVMAHPEGVDEEPSSARITAQLDYMADNLEKLQVLVIRLEEFLDPILLPELVDEANVRIPTPDFPTSLVSRRIDDLNRTIGALQRKVQVTTERVQL